MNETPQPEVCIMVYNKKEDSCPDTFFLCKRPCKRDE